MVILAIFGMFYPIRLFLKDKWIGVPFSAVILVQLFMIWYVGTRIQPSEEPIFLHYNIMFGVDLIGEWWKIWFIPLGGFMIFIFNFLISYFFYGKDRFISRFLSLVTVSFEAMLTLGLILIVGLNL